MNSINLCSVFPDKVTNRLDKDEAKEGRHDVWHDVVEPRIGNVVQLRRVSHHQRTKRPHDESDETTDKEDNCNGENLLESEIWLKEQRQKRQSVKLTFDARFFICLALSSFIAACFAETWTNRKSRQPNIRNVVLFCEQLSTFLQLFRPMPYPMIRNSALIT